MCKWANGVDHEPSLSICTPYRQPFRNVKCGGTSSLRTEYIGGVTGLPFLLLPLLLLLLLVLSAMAPKVTLTLAQTLHLHQYRHPLLASARSPRHGPSPRAKVGCPHSPSLLGRELLGHSVS